MSYYDMTSEPYTLTLTDGEEVIIDMMNRDEVERIKLVDGAVFYVDDGGCDICIDDVYDIDTETHLVPEAWYDESVKPTRAAYGLN